MNRNDIIDWIWHKRIPFFFKSQMYAEYKVNDASVLWKLSEIIVKLARALIEYDLAENGGVERRVANGLKYIQFHCFSKMSRFSKFCKFLSDNGEGLKLVAFYIAAQQLFIAHNEQDPDFPLLKGLLRLGFTTWDYI